MGFLLTPKTRLLHLGCGSGEIVCRLRELGIEAFGFDDEDRVSCHNAEKKCFFRFSSSDRGVIRESSAWERVRIGYDNAAFDIAVSISLLAQISNLHPIMAEIARVLVPTGIAVHLYASANRSKGWLFRLKEELQRKLAPYPETLGRRYTQEELLSVCGLYFNNTRFEENRYYVNLALSKQMMQRPRNKPLSLRRSPSSLLETGVLCLDGVRAKKPNTR
jgi:SAM-dependent methyltransferase